MTPCPSTRRVDGGSRLRPRRSRTALLAAACCTLVGGLAAAGNAWAVCTLRSPENIGINNVVALGRQANYRSGSGRLQIGGNVTDITAFRNGTSCMVRVAKRDPKFLQPDEEAVEIIPGDTLRSSMWVPWGDQNDLATVMWIYFDGEPYFAVWQRHDRLRFTTRALLERARTAGDRRLLETAPEAPGLALRGGPRVLNLAVSRDGIPYFYFLGVAQ